MPPKDLARRNFLKTAGTSLLAAPLVNSLADRADAAPAPPPPPPPAALPKLTLNVRDFGVRADGTTKDTVALQQAIDRCWVLGGGEVVVPAGEYLTGALALRSNTFLRLEKDAILNGSPDFADYPVSQVRWEGKWIQGYTGLIYAIGVNNSGIVGPGKINGNPKVGGRPGRDNPLRHPALIEPMECTNLLFEDFYTTNGLMWCLHATYCENLTFRNLNIRSTTGNGDGIDIDSCKHVLIEGCDISTGDDCIAIKSGRGSEAYKLLRTTEDVVIRDCTFADSIFACIGIGSETSGGIRGVHIERCKFVKAGSHAIYIKSRPGRGAFIEDIVAENLEVGPGMKSGFLRLNILGSGIQDQFPVPGDEGIPTTKNYRFSNVHVENCPVLVSGTEIHPNKPLDGLVLENITGTCAKGISLANVKYAVIRDIHVTGFTGPLLSIHEVTGIGLEDAVQTEGPKIPDPVATPAEPYVLH